MATEDKDLNDFAAGFADEREPTRGDDETFAVAEDAPAGGAADTSGAGMDLDAAATTDKPEGGEGGAAIVVAVDGAADGGTAAGERIERQPEGGGASVDAADNGGGGNSDGLDGGAPAAVDITVAGAGSGDDSPIKPALEDDEPTDPKDIQRKKSWEGRLKADEERLKARKDELDALAKELEAKGVSAGQEPGEATADALDAVADKTNNPDMAAAADDLAAQVDAGEITPEAAMAQLKEDFGEPFVKLIESVATAAASKALDSVRADVDKLRGDADEVISHLQNEGDRRHFEAISSKYPDFNEIGKSAEFNEFVETLPPEEKADAERVRQSGSAKEIIALLDAFKAKGEPAADAGGAGAEPVAAAAERPTVGASDEELDAAAGVRGGGMALPSEPAGDNDFARGWDDAPDVKTGRG